MHTNSGLRCVASFPLHYAAAPRGGLPAKAVAVADRVARASLFKTHLHKKFSAINWPQGGCSTKPREICEKEDLREVYKAEKK